MGVFSNPQLLTNIHKSKRSTKIHCNAGVVQVTHMGTLPRYVLVWLNGEGTANILSMANATMKYHVSYASKDGDRFILQKADEQLVFNRSPSGLYYHDIRDRDILMVATITGNHEGYTDQDFLWRQKTGRDWP